MEALKVLILLVLVIYAIKEHKKISISNHREELFNIRGELFLLPLKYNISYDEKIYRHYERTINNRIRFAHKLSYSNVLLFERCLRKNNIQLKKTEPEGINNYPPELVEEFDKIREKLTETVINYFMKTSIVFWIHIVIELFKTVTITTEDIKLNISLKDMNDCIKVMSSETKSTEPTC